MRSPLSARLLALALAVLPALAPSAASAQTYPSPTFAGVRLGGPAGAMVTGIGTGAGTLAAGDDPRILGALQSATAAATYAPLSSPTFTGTMSVPALVLSTPGSSGPADGLSAVPAFGTRRRTLAEIAGDAPSLESFIPVGTTFAQYLADATSTFQAAATATCAKSPAGGVVRLPARTLVLPAAVSITWSCAIHWLGAPPSEVPEASGTWLRVTGTTASPFAITSPAARGSTFEHLGVTQNQPPVTVTAIQAATTAGSASITTASVGYVPALGDHVTGPGIPDRTFVEAVSGGAPYTLTLSNLATASAGAASLLARRFTPTVYPPVFNVAGAAGTTKFRDVLASPVYDLVRADLSGRLDTADVRGQVLHTAYWIDRSYDTSHLNGVQHFWPFKDDDPAIMRWQTSNTDYVVLARVDGLEVPDFFAYGGRSALKLVQSATDNGGGAVGFATKIHFGNLYADSVASAVWSPKAGGALPFQRPQVRIENLAAAPIVPGSATNASLGNSSGLRVDPAGGLDLSVGRFSIEHASAAPIRLDNTAVPVRLRIGDLAVSDATGPSIVAASGSVGNDVAIASPVSNGLQPLTNTVAMAFSAPLPAGGVVAVASGGAFAMSSAQRGNVFSGAASGFTITMPASPFDGMEVGQTFTSAINGLSIAPAAGQGVSNAPSSVAAGTALRWIWVAGANGWFPR